MAPKQRDPLLQQLRDLAAREREAPLGDAELLDRFLSGRDEAAFAALVRRHGRLVLGVCRHVLRHEQDAEDAFQATFLMLARKAAALARREALAAWLHGTASRIALRARRDAARRRARERRTALMAPRQRPELGWSEVQAVLDEEIQRLPARQRGPVVLCLLEGKSGPEAARALGLAEGTLWSRLGRARQQLQKALARRGVALAPLLAASPPSSGRVLPAALAEVTTRLALGHAAGAASARAVRLADGALGSLVSLRTKVVSVLLLTLGLTVGGLTAQRHAADRDPEHAAQMSRAEPVVPSPPRKEGESATRKDLVGDPLPAEVVARMGSGRMRHPWTCRVLFSPDGKALLTAGRGGVRAWERETGRLLWQLPMPGWWCVTSRVSAGGLTVATLDSETGVTTVLVVDPFTGQERRRLLVQTADRHDDWRLAVSPDGKRLARVTRQAVCIHDLATGRETLRIPLPKDSYPYLEFSPDSRTIAFSLADTIVLHDARRGRRVRELRLAGRHVSNLFFAPDGRFLASMSHAGRGEDEASVWDLGSGRERHHLKPPPRGRYGVGAFSPDGKFLALGERQSPVVLFDLDTGKPVRQFAAKRNVNDLIFSPDGATLAGAFYGSIFLWDVASGKLLPQSADPELDIVGDLRFSSDGRRLLGSSGYFHRWHFAWDPASGREIHRLSMRPAEGAVGLAVSPDERLLALGEKTGAIRLQDAATGRLVRVLRGHEQMPQRALFTLNGHLVSCGDGTIRVWDVTSGRQLQRLPDPPGYSPLGISSDGRWLATNDQAPEPIAVVVWDLDTGREKARLGLPDGAMDAAFSPDGRLLAVTRSGSGRRELEPTEVKVWDVAGRQERHLRAERPVLATRVAFSPDGRMLAVGGDGGSLSLWELASGRRRHRFLGHAGTIIWLAFSPDGRRLAASSGDAPVYVWDVTGTPDHRPRSLSRAERERCWSDLAGDDAEAGFQAIRRLAAAPDPALPFLSARLRPAAAPDPTHLHRLLANLDGPHFADRQRAEADLERLGDVAIPTLHEALAARPSLELRRRLERLVEKEANAVPSPETLRALRCVEALEWIGTPAACRQLDELAKGAPGARLTRAAAEARLRSVPRTAKHD